MSAIKPITQTADQQYTTGLVSTSTSATTSVPLKTVPTGKSYSLSAFELSTDATANTPIVVQIQVNGVTVYTSLLNQLEHLCRKNVLISAIASQSVTLLLSQTTSIQKVAYFIEGIET